MGGAATPEPSRRSRPVGTGTPAYPRKGLGPVHPPLADAPTTPRQVSARSRSRLCNVGEAPGPDAPVQNAVVRVGHESGALARRDSIGPRSGSAHADGCPPAEGVV